MNYGVYIFGDFGDGYTQYPDDQASDVFKSNQRYLKSQTMIAINRDDNLIYYSYYQKLISGADANNYIGFCCVFNGVYIDDFKSFYTICENAVTTLVVSGNVLEFTKQGEIISTVNNLYKCPSEIKFFKEYLDSQFSSLFSTAKPLPPVNYSVSSNAIKTHGLEDNNSEIIQSVSKFSHIFIKKSGGNSESELKSYSEILRSLNNTNEHQKQEISKLKKQKKRTTAVAWLASLIVLAMIGIVLIYSVANERFLEIKSLNYKVSSLSDSIVFQNEQISTLQSNVNERNMELNKLDSIIAQRNNTIKIYDEANRDLNKKNWDLNKKNTSLATTIENQKKSIQSLKQENDQIKKAPTFNVDELEFKLNYAYDYSSSSIRQSGQQWLVNLHKREANLDMKVFYKGKLCKSQRLVIKK